MLVVALPARFPLRFLLAFALGALHAVAFVDDAGWPLEIAALAGLVALSLRAAREVEGWRGRRRAILGGARVGFAFGLGWFLVGVSWIYISLHTYGGLAAPLAGAAILLFCAYLAIYPALACAAFAAFRHTFATRTPALRIASILGFAGLWTLSELGRGYVFTGFPWLASGYAHVGGPLAGYAPLVGVYGVTTVASAIAAAVALAVGRPRRPALERSTIVTLLVVLGSPLVGSLLARIDWTAPIGNPISVRLLQGNVAQDVKFLESNFDATADGYLDAIEQKRADLIVLPETAFPVFLADLPEAIAQRLARDARTMHADIAFGIPIEDPGERYYNSVLSLSPAPDGAGVSARATGAQPEAGRPAAATGAAPADAPPRSTDGHDAPAAKADGDALARIVAQRYDKSHLVPFGEFVPTGFHWFVRLLDIPLGDFNRGAITQQPMTLAGRKVAFNICYEDLFGEEIIRQAGVANILINVSNVAWFGDSMALPQHLDISRMRSIETGRPMLRATNTGMTASIDPHGRVLAVLKPFTVGSLDVMVQGMTGLTPFIRLGNLPALLSSLMLVVIGLLLPMRTRRAGAVGADVLETR